MTRRKKTRKRVTRMRKKRKKRKKKKLSKMKYSLLLIISKKKIYYILPTQKAQLKKKVFCTHILTSPYNLRMRWYLGTQVPGYLPGYHPGNTRVPHFVSYNNPATTTLH